MLPATNFEFLSVHDIRRITTGGVVTEFSNPTVESAGSMGAITSGPDGNLWFITNGVPSTIWRLTPPPSTSPLFAAVLPSSRSVQVGGTVATVFSSVINSGTTNLDGCGAQRENRSQRVV